MDININIKGGLTGAAEFICFKCLLKRNATPLE
jgi:hypothetical protein